MILETMEGNEHRDLDDQYLPVPQMRSIWNVMRSCNSGPSTEYLEFIQ